MQRERNKIMLLNSDWHIHSEYSYDAKNTLSEIAEAAIKFGYTRVGITDHVNFNDDKFLGDLHASAAAVKEAQKKYPFMILGVELTPIALPEFEYIAKHGNSEGFIPPSCTPYDLELAVTKEELTRLGVKYAIGAAHWRLDSLDPETVHKDLNENIREWYRQQMWLAADERVTILGHPWFHGKSLWYEDFSVIPKSMKADIAAALKENKKYVELNAHFFRAPMASEKFKTQYSEYMREMFEMGIPVTYGSDMHANYHDERELANGYLLAAGFKEGDIGEVREADFFA